MTEDLKELSEFVRANPDDHNQRWRLAKKLYQAWEYRSALEHFKKLKEVWPNQQNVIYYLATTHYRMGNSEDAIAELEALLEVYPSDVSVRRLLARIYEASGQLEAAKQAYREVQINSPSPSVDDAVKRLDNARDGSVAEVSGADEISSDKTMITCRYCGAVNDAFLQKCSTCHASLASEVQAQAPSPSDSAQEIPIPEPSNVAFAVIVLATIAVIAGGVILAFVLLN